VDLAAVFVVGDIADPVDLVLDVPVLADPSGQLGRLGLVDAQISEGIDGFGVKAFRLVESVSAASDLGGLAACGKSMPVEMARISGCGSLRPWPRSLSRAASGTARRGRRRAGHAGAAGFR
jgi:hypothetical protein